MDKEIQIDVTIDGAEYGLNFRVTADAYNRYINAINPKDKISPAHNFVRAVYAGDKKDIDPMLKMPGVGLQLAGEILEEYMPQVEIITKKSKHSQTA